jgi:multicomponent Na+:H+ antiporter subunit A
MLSLWLIVVPFFLALLSPVAKGGAAAGYGKVVALILLGLLVGLFWGFYDPNAHGWLNFHAAWVPSLGVSLSFEIDGLSKLMLALILSIGSVVFIYASEYLRGDTYQHRFYSVLLMFLVGMIGIVISDNLILLFVFWELTSITSYLLIGTKSTSQEARSNALQALVVTGGGGVIMLLGILWLGSITGTYAISELRDLPSGWTQHEAMPFVVGCLLIGAFTKSGQFPFHFWLPNAMSAPTPVSSFLHSATMVKAGVFLVLKLNPVFSELDYWSIALLLVGGTTMIYAAAKGLLQFDLKKILAYTTLSVLGLLMMLIGEGSPLALKSALIFLFGHALYKSTLFMCAGNVDHAVHNRDVRTLGSLRAVMPITAMAAGLAALSKSGFPPFFGFVGKEYVYKAGIASDWVGPFVLIIAVVSNALLMALALKVGIHPFWHRSEKKLDDVYAPSKWMSWGPLVLAMSGLLAGTQPKLIGNLFVEPALQVITLNPINVELKLWHGLNTAFALSLLTLAVGVFIYSLRHRFWKNSPLNPQKEWFERLYDIGFSRLMSFAKVSTRFIQSGSLRQYFYWIIGSLCALTVFKIVLVGKFPSLSSQAEWSLLDLSIVVMIVMGALLALITESRIQMLLALGLVGFAVALIFAVYSAPDLAITQILVETLIVVLFVFSISHLSKIKAYSKPGSRIRDAILAGLGGLVVTLLILKSQWFQFAPSISEKFIEWSYPLAKGKNVVNVILVDFRALDTLGEIIVLGIAALGVYILLDGGKLASRKIEAGLAQGQNLKGSTILTQSSRFLVPAVFSLVFGGALPRSQSSRWWIYWRAFGFLRICAYGDFGRRHVRPQTVAHLTASAVGDGSPFGSR